MNSLPCYTCGTTRRPIADRDPRFHERGWGGMRSDVPLCDRCAEQHADIARRREGRKDD